MATTLFGVNLHNISSSIRNALSYWGDSLIGSLPTGIRKNFIVGEEQLLIVQNQEDIRLIDWVNGHANEVAHFAHAEGITDEALISAINNNLTKDKEFSLVISDDSILSKLIDFPSAAIDNLHQALMYEMDKHTPFPNEEILFDAVVEQQHAAKAQVRLYILHRSQIQSLLTTLQQSNINLDRVCSDSERTINLLPESLRRKKPLFPYKRNIALSLALLFLLLGCLALPLYFKRDTAIQLDAQMAQLSEQALGEGELWERRDAVETVIEDFMQSYPMPFLEIYEALSKALPDDTWLTNLVFKKGKFNIRGESNDAAGLIGIINAHPYFKNARIASPIIKSQQKNNKEVFNITFESVTQNGGG